MRKTRITLAVAVATALLSSPPLARAAVLGEVMSLSAIGAPFRAEIRLTGSARADCLRVGAASAGDDGLPWLTQARVSVMGGTAPRVVVSAARTVHEPALKLAIEDVCENRLRREYTLLMPYPDAAPAPTAATRAPITPLAAAPASGRTWTTAPGESLESLARSLYPDDANARRRFMRATAAANPELFSSTADQFRPLPTGTTLTVPDLRRLSAAATPRPKPQTSTPEARPRTEPTKRAARTPADTAPRTDRLIVESDTTATKSTSPSISRETSSAAPSALSETLSQREREVAAAIDRSIIAEMELLARIKELEEARIRLEARIEALGLAAANAAAEADSVATPAAAVATPITPEHPASSTTDYRDYYLFGGLGLAVLLLALLLRRRRAAQQPESVSQLHGAKTTTSAAPATTTATATAPIIDTAPKPLATPTSVFADTLDWHPPEAPPKVSAATANLPGEQPEEHQSAIELADIMMSFGRLHGAAETLSEFIRGNPKQAVTPWLKLLEVYRAAGLRAEFDTIAKELNKTFNVVAVTWENYDDLRSNELSLEQMPHVMEKIRSLWGTHECRTYLQHLLRDNRDGTRAGFPFAAIDDILVLSATLDEELGQTPPAPNASTPH